MRRSERIGKRRPTQPLPTTYSLSKLPHPARHRLLLPVIGNSLHIVVCKRRQLFLLGFFGAAFR